MNSEQKADQRKMKINTIALEGIVSRVIHVRKKASVQLIVHGFSACSFHLNSPLPEFVTVGNWVRFYGQANNLQVELIKEKC